MDPLSLVFSSESFQNWIRVVDTLVAMILLAMFTWFCLQWIDRWFIRYFGQRFILSRIPSKELYAFFFTTVLQNKDPKTEPCYICLERIDNYVVLPCSHRVHVACLKIWLEVSTQCPMCRQELE